MTPQTDKKAKSKAQHIRDYLEQNPKAKARDVVMALREESGIVVSTKQVYTELGDLKLQDRDIRILRMLYDSRLMSAVQIAALLGESYNQGLERRLFALYKKRYLGRPANQEAYRLQPSGRLQGRLHLVYALGDRGAQFLTKASGLKVSKVSWAKKNREIKATQINHALMVSNFRACLYTAMRPETGKYPYHWAQGDELKTVFFTRQTKGFSEENTRRVVRPDAFFALDVPGEGQSRAGRFFFLEADRSTMDHRRVLRKLQDYWQFWKTGLHAKRFQGIEHFVVLTVCKSATRRDRLAETAKRADDRQTGSRLFRFASETDFELEKPDSLLTPIWYTPGRKEPEVVW